MAIIGKFTLHIYMYILYAQGVLECYNFIYIIYMAIAPPLPSLQTHSGSVWRVTWAHPEFGQVLATCSFDRTVGVWEEQGDV